MSAPTVHGAGPPAAPSPGRFAAVAAGALCLALSTAAALGALSGPALLASAVLLAQGLFLSGWFRTTQVPGGTGGTVLAGATAGTLDVVLVVRAGASGSAGEPEAALAPFAWVLGPSVLLAFIAQLARRNGRVDVVTSLTATLAATVLVALGALLVPALGQVHGTFVVLSALTGAALAGLLAPPPTQSSGPFPTPGPTAGRGPAARAAGRIVLVVGGAAVLAGGLLSKVDTGSGAPRPLAMASVAAVAGAVAAAGVRLGMSAATPGTAPRESRVGGVARITVVAALPVLLAGPVAYVLAEILAGWLPR